MSPAGSPHLPISRQVELAMVGLELATAVLELAMVGLELATAVLVMVRSQLD